MIGKACNALALAAFLAGAQPAAAQGSGGLTMKVELEKSTPAAGGQPQKVAYVPADVVVPGNRVRITLNFTNDRAAPAAGLKLINPIPAGLIFDGTADPTGFGVSTNGGKSFGALAALTVAVAGASPRPATAGDVTHVRWIWPDALTPGQTRSVAFFARVR